MGEALATEGWSVRGTSRTEEGLEPIRAAGIEAALADPAMPGTVLDLVGDVAVVHWLLGSAAGAEAEVAAIHGPKLERLLERFVDTPVRGFAYEAVGSADPQHLSAGRGVVESAAATWRIPVEFLEAGPGDPEAWLQSAVAATRNLVSQADKAI
ncbi:MAG TPA: hypothetical protein VIT85_06010 [Solirubrobacterales bacterium]